MGIDVSSYQKDIDWAAVKSSGVTFAYAKATEGRTVNDAYFVENEVNARSAGMPIGAYHFPHPELNSAADEAAHFWSIAGPYIKNNSGYMVPMLDFEQAPGSGYTKTSASQWANDWCNTIVNDAGAAGVTVRPIVYTYISFANSWLDGTVTQWPLWMAHPNGEDPQTGAPASTSPWATWNFWQYGGGTVPGVTTGAVDEDVFQGTAATLQSYVIGNASSSAGPGLTLRWDPGAAHASPGSGGAGNWDTFSGNWWLSGATNLAWSTGGDNAIFAGTAAGVTVGSAVTAGSITFSTPGYVLSGSQTITLNSNANISYPAGAPTYIQCVLGGTGYNLSGGGVLVLSNPGNWSGSASSAETITGPATTLVVTAHHAVGNGGVTLNLVNGGIYQDNDTTNGDQFLLPGSVIALGTGGGVFDNPNASLTMTNRITGAGSLTTIGTTYTLTMTDTGNNYSGGTIVKSGALKANAAGVLGSTSGALTVSGGTLDLNGASHTVGAVTISGGTIQNGTLSGTAYAGKSGTVSAILAGSGAMTQTTSGTLTLTGVNTYSGGTTIGGGGVYSILADSALGAATSAVTLNGGCLKNDGAPVSLNAGRTITLGASGGFLDAGWAPTNSITVHSKLTGSGSLCINLDGSPIVLANPGNNYSGNTIIGTNGPGYYSSGNQAWLKLGASSVIPNGSGYGNVIMNQAYFGLLDLAGFTQTINGLSGSGIVNNSTGNGSLSVGNNNATSTFSGLIENTGGTLALTKVGTGIFTLSGTNSYTGNTTINGGVLALGATGSINTSPKITVAAGATLDVSAIASYAMSASNTLSASGGAAPATIKGGTLVNLGARPIVLTYDGSHPALTISQGTLSLTGNVFTVNGSVLPGGVYTLIQQTSGNIANLGAHSVTGTAIPASGATASILVSGGNVLLTVTYATATTLSPLTPSTYGQLASFTATVAPTPPDGTVQFYDNGVALGGLIPVSGGTASYGTNTLLVGNHPITATYNGMIGYTGSSTTNSSIQQVTLPPNNAPVNISSTTMLGDGTVQMSYTGIPGYTYVIQATADLTPPATWTNLSTNVADINGQFNFIDLDATNYSGRLYRTAVQ